MVGEVRSKRTLTDLFVKSPPSLGSAATMARRPLALQAPGISDSSNSSTSALVCDGRHEGGHDVFRYKFTYKFSHHEGGHDFFVQVVDVENIHHF